MKKSLSPADYDLNQDYVYDAGFEIEDPGRLHECSLCAKGKHDECQAAAIALCKCFYNDHEESW
jgi:hypothetical protein